MFLINSGCNILAFADSQAELAGGRAEPVLSVVSASLVALRPEMCLLQKWRVSGVVAELGGSTSHLASLARERGIPMVLGALDATSVIPDGAQVGVDGVAGLVRWIQ